MGIDEVVTAPASPWQNAYVERIIGSLRWELLDHVIILNERHLKRLLSSYLDYYHPWRTHQPWKGMHRTVDQFDLLNQAMLFSVRLSMDSITTIFQWQHEFSGRTGGGAGSGSGGDEGDSGKKVVSPQGRRAMARYAIGRGLSHRRSAWLCSTPRSGIHYRSRRERGDRHLSAALRIVSRADPAWGYRLAAGYLRLRGWAVNDKRVYRLWRRNGLCLPPYRPSRKMRSGARLDGLALRRNDVWAWDVVHDRYHDDEPLRCLTVKDEATGYSCGQNIHAASRW